MMLFLIAPHANFLFRSLLLQKQKRSNRKDKSLLPLRDVFNPFIHLLVV